MSITREKIEEKLKQIDELIRAGSGLKASTLLRKLSSGKIPQNLRARYASLARRAQVPQLALRLLNPVVRPFGDHKLGGDAEEQVEYASALIRTEAIAEGIEILESISDLPPEGLLIKAFAHVAQWDYKTSIPLLKKYCSHPEITPYQKLIGNINLAAALVHEKEQGALELLDQILHETKENNYSRLLGYAVQLKAQWMVATEEYDLAISLLEESRNIITGVGGLDALFVDKWSVIARALRNPGDKKALRVLRAFKQKAKEHQHWETPRDCDFYEALSTHNEKLFLYLYIGSPFPSFRERITAEYGKVDIPEAYLRVFTGRPRSSQKLDLLLTGIAPNGEKLKVGQVLHRTLIALASDFYRPFSLAALHSHIYPEEIYMPEISATKIRQVKKRLVQWLEKNQVPLMIEEISGNYSLTIAKGYSYYVPIVEGPPKPNYQILLNTLQKHFGNQVFTKSEASAFLNIPPYTILRILRDGTHQGILQRLGNNVKTSYQFLSSQNELKKVS